jgi:hypothetical protein
MRRPDHAPGVLHRDAALGLLHEDDAGDDAQTHHDDQQEGEGAVLLEDREHGAREGGHDLGEDQDRHAVADAAVGDELAEPHDDRGARHHGDHDQQEAEDVVGVVQQRQRAGPAEELSGPGEGHDAGRLQQRQAQRQVAGVLGDLLLAGLTLLLQGLQPRYDDREQLHHDAGGDVGHDPEREDRELQERATGEHVDQRDDAVGIGLCLVQARLDVADVDARCRQRAAEPEQHHDAEHEQQLAAQVRGAECVDEGA